MIFLLISQISEIQNKYLKIKYLKADFTQTIKQGENTITQKGYLEYKSPNELKFYIKEPQEQQIIFKDSFMITIFGKDTFKRTLPQNSMFNPYYFLTDGIKFYKSELKKINNKIQIDLSADTLFYQKIQFILEANTYKLLKIKAFDNAGFEYEVNLSNIIEK
ncbi:MAG: outer membrane lipoprotein carrier protein LolA [candidate division WOR-3 bacterium]|jgi:outer membrane lipoprotein-sorting protein